MATETLFDRFERACHGVPERIALEVPGGPLTYAQLAERVEKWSRELTALGLKPQEHVLIAVDDAVDFIAVWFAIWRIGCIPIPLEASIAAAELARAVAESQAHWLLTCVPAHAQVLNPPSTGTLATQLAWTYARIAPPDAEASCPDTALFFYTSGTTGTPKCVVFSHAAMLANVVSLAEAIALSEQDVVLTPLSPVLPATLATAVLPALCRGATLALPATPIPGSILQQIARTRTTIFFAVPYLYELLATAMALRASDVWRDVRLCLSSSAFMEGSLFDKFYQATRLPIRSVYCSSEAGACTFNDAEDVALARESVGRALPGVELQVLDGAGQAVLGSDTGQVVVRGSHVSSGYFRRPELQKQVFEAGWVKTGDLGSLDAQGYLRLKGRLSETINVSGYLVNPFEVEQCLSSHPAVAEVLVYGLADAQLGEVVAAQVVVATGQPVPGQEELRQLCARTLMHYKVPRRIDFVRELPKSRYGKVDRRSTAFGHGKPA